jgi:AcrR family transcriptional regulator
MEATRDEIVRTSIVEAAKELFQKYGLAKTTMEDIAKAIGKGKSSLYYYYATKEDIFEAVIVRDKASIIEETKAAMEKAATAEEKIRAFAVTIHKAVRKRVILFGILSSELRDNMCMMKLRQKYDAIELDMIRSIISFGIETGEFDETFKDRIDDVAFIGISTLRGLQINLIYDDERTAAGAKRLIDTAVELIIRGLKK